MHRRRLIAGAAGFAAASALPNAARAAVDFAGKSVTLLVPFGVGGGNDLWARFNQRFLQKYLPGRPSVIVKNSPGGGSVAGANLFAATAKPDGLTVLISSASTQFPYLLGDRRVKYEYHDLPFFLAAPTGGAAYIAPKFGVTSIRDLKKAFGQKLYFGSQGATSLDMVALLGFRLLGLDVDHIFGLPGRAEALLGFQRGEMTIDYQTTTAYLRSSRPLVEHGEAVPLFSWGVTDASGALARDPNFPDLPHIGEAYEIVHGEQPEGIEWTAFRAFLLSGFPGQKSMLLQKGTAPEIVEAYRKAIRDMRDDPDYVAERDQAIGEYEQVTDAAGEALFREATTITPEARGWVRDFLSRNYRVELD